MRSIQLRDGTVLRVEVLRETPDGPVRLALESGAIFMSDPPVASPESTARPASPPMSAPCLAAELPAPAARPPSPAFEAQAPRPKRLQLRPQPCPSPMRPLFALLAEPQAPTPPAPEVPRSPTQGALACEPDSPAPISAPYLLPPAVALSSHDSYDLPFVLGPLSP